MSVIKDKILHSKQQVEEEEVEPNQLFIHRLLGLVCAELRATGDRDWLLDCVGEASIRISQIEGVAGRVASGLVRLGFSTGDTLHTAYNSCLDFYWPVFGAWLVGGLVSVADPSLSEDMVKSQILDTKAKIVVCTSDAASRYLAANERLSQDQRVSHILVIDKEPWQELPKGCKSFRNLFNDSGALCPTPSSLPYSPEQPALVHWSSGTTGKPKGIIHSQRYLHNMLHTSKIPPPRSISLSTNIMFHAGAFRLPMFGGIFNKFTCYFIQEKDFTGPVLVDTIAKYQPTFYMCGTNHFTALSNETAQVGQDLSSLAVVTPLGAPITETSVNKLKALLPGLSVVGQVYGSTEVARVSVSLDCSCLGSLFPGVSAYIREKVSGERLGPNQSGEIMVKTKDMLLGYLNREVENRELLDKDGFAYIGDIGYYDEAGKLYYKSRDKELLKVNNHWFGPGEVESLLEQLPWVTEAVVWGSYDPATGDDKVNAGLVLTTQSSQLEVLAREDVVLHVANNLQTEKHLTGDIFFLDCIPHNPQGKKLRQQLKQKYAN